MKHAIIAIFASLLGYLLGRHEDYKKTLNKAYNDNEQQATSLMETMKELEDLN